MRKPSAKKRAGKKASAKSKSRKPVDMQAIRETIANLVGAEAVDICAALAEEARKGELAPAKFLFEMSGLYPASAASNDAEELDQDQEDGSDLARVLLRRLALPGEKAEEDGELAAGNEFVGNSVE